MPDFYYPCKPDIFAATYEPADGQTDPERVGAGVDYCTVHAGIRNEGESFTRCDFAADDDQVGDDGEPRPCVLVPLYYDTTTEPT